MFGFEESGTDTGTRRSVRSTPGPIIGVDRFRSLVRPDLADCRPPPPIRISVGRSCPRSDSEDANRHLRSSSPSPRSPECDSGARMNLATLCPASPSSDSHAPPPVSGPIGAPRRTGRPRPMDPRQRPTLCGQWKRERCPDRCGPGCTARKCRPRAVAEHYSSLNAASSPGRAGGMWSRSRMAPNSVCNSRDFSIVAARSLTRFFSAATLSGLAAATLSFS
jgi:hypothetical protein